MFTFFISSPKQYFQQTLGAGPSETTPDSVPSFEKLDFSGLPKSSDIQASFAPEYANVSSERADEIQLAVKQIFETFSPNPEAIKSSLKEMFIADILKTPGKAQELSELIKQSAQKQLAQIQSNPNISKTEQAIASSNIIIGSTSARNTLAVNMTQYEMGNTGNVAS